MHLPSPSKILEVSVVAVLTVVVVFFLLEWLDVEMNAGTLIGAGGYWIYLLFFQKDTTSKYKPNPTNVKEVDPMKQNPLDK